MTLFVIKTSGGPTVGAGDRLRRPLEEGAMPEDHSQPIESILIRSADS